MASADSFRKHLKTTQQHVPAGVRTPGLHLWHACSQTWHQARLPPPAADGNPVSTSKGFGSGSNFGSLKSSVEPNAKAFANFDMFFNMIEGNDGIRIDVDYNADVFDPATIDRWIGHFKTLAAAVAERHGSLHPRVAAARRERKNWIVNDLNQTTSEYDHHEFAFSLFSRKAAEQPEAIAVEFAGNSLTYRELVRQIEPVGALHPDEDTGARPARRPPC